MTLDGVREAVILTDVVVKFDAHSRHGGATFEVYEDRTGKFRFRLRASTSQVVATSEAYETRAGRGQEGC